MRYVIGALTIIKILQDDDRSTSSFDDEVPSPMTHHDSPPSHGLGGRSPSSHFPPHESLDTTFNSLPILHFLPTTPPNPLVSDIDLSLPPLCCSPLYVSRYCSSIDPPPAPPQVSLV